MPADKPVGPARRFTSRCESPLDVGRPWSRLPRKRDTQQQIARIVQTDGWCRCVITRYKARSRMAPNADMIHPARWPGAYSPSILPMKPATSAPATPSSMVAKIPPGSFPGMMSFASAPISNPINNIQINANTKSLHYFALSSDRELQSLHGLLRPRYEWHALH
jgi:hypothetical protein